MSATNAHTDAKGEITQNDVPIHASDEEATGMPDSGRQQTETAAHPEGGNAEASKHDHKAPQTSPPET